MEQTICPVCGQPIKDNYVINGKCFTCDFWEKRLIDDAEYPEHTVCIIDGAHYIIEDENDTSCFRGFAGRKFIIKFNDGTIVTTTNLWYQGVIPENFKDKFPNNAEFVDGLRWRQIGNCKYLI